MTGAFLVGAALIVTSATLAADHDAPSATRASPSASIGIDDADEKPFAEKGDESTSSAPCHSPTWGSFSCDTGLPAPDERNLDGSFKYALCEKGEEVYDTSCYPYHDELQHWQDTHH